MDNLTVTIVMPAFNAGGYISAAICSVLNQTFRDFELIVVDNLSTDETMKIALKFDDPRIKVTQCLRSGAAAARNTGLELARGKYLQFLDADDLLAPEKIQRQLDVLSDSPPRSIATCAWGRFSCDVDNATFIEEPVWKSYSTGWRWLLESWQGGGMMQTACWLVPTDLAKEAGPWNESLSLNDDGEYFCRVLLASQRVAYSPVRGVLYRSEIAVSLSRRVDDAAIESAFRVCDLYQRHIQNAGHSGVFQAALRRNYLNFIHTYHPARKDLMQRAWQLATALGNVSSDCIGGAFFQRTAKHIGFMNALRVRELLRAMQLRNVPRVCA